MVPNEITFLKKSIHLLKSSMSSLRSLFNFLNLVVKNVCTCCVINVRNVAINTVSPD